MHRRFAVVGLALAMCGTVVQGQGGPDGLSQAQRLDLSQRLASASQTKPLGQFVIRMDVVGPQLTRVYVTRNGVEEATFEAPSFTVAMGPNGTTLRSSEGIITMQGIEVTGGYGPALYRFEPNGELGISENQLRPIRK